jgi:hypothetical protein
MAIRSRVMHGRRDVPAVLPFFMKFHLKLKTVNG